MHTRETIDLQEQMEKIQEQLDELMDSLRADGLLSEKRTHEDE